jgi:hypothetical protein
MQDDTGVTVRLADGSQEQAEYVIGCDVLRCFVGYAIAIRFPDIHNPDSVALPDLHPDGLPSTPPTATFPGMGCSLFFPP